MGEHAAEKVTVEQLRRAAYLYVRQSTLRQVLENTTSTDRQYALRGRAVALGWAPDQVIVVDDDLGRSGASAEGREGFQRLVADVGMGKAGIVIGLEVSRLARNNADWHRLLEICALTETLILDDASPPSYGPAGNIPNRARSPPAPVTPPRPGAGSLPGRWRSPRNAPGRRR